MDHFKVEQWADFARKITPPDAAAKMQRHLDSGCRDCARSLSTMKKVAELAGREATYEPESGILRIVKTLFAASQPATSADQVREILPLVFDSFAQPAMAGVRTAIATSRQLLYRKGGCCIDIRIEHVPGSKEAILVGQVLDSGQQGRDAASILVELMSGDKVIASTATTSYGEFQFLFPAERQLELCFGISSQNIFWIKIPPLENIPESGMVITD